MTSRTVALRVRPADMAAVETITAHLRANGASFAGLSDAIRHAIAVTAATVAAPNAAPKGPEA